MLTVDSLTDEEIRALEIEAARLDDIEIVRDCLRAYRHGGRGAANPYARVRIVGILNARVR